MCMKYAELERNLGEIDRARAIYVHAAQMADPRSDSEFWSKWNDFEVQHGNEDTFREMLRIKRSVSASYSQVSFDKTCFSLKKSCTPDYMELYERWIWKEDQMIFLPESTLDAPFSRQTNEARSLPGLTLSLASR